MNKLLILAPLVVAFAACATLPDGCAAGQTVEWDEAAEGWTCADPVSGVERHSHQVTEIRSACQDGQMVTWDRDSSGWICTDAEAHLHEGAQLDLYPPTYYSVDVRAGQEEDLESLFIEGHRFCALSEIQAARGGRCEVVLTTEGFSLQAWAGPETRTECGAVCF